MTPIDERAAVGRGEGPRNYCDDHAREAHYIELVATGRLDEALALHRQPMRFRNHMSVAELTATLGEALVRDYLVFTVERHPYERAISLAVFELRMADYMKGRAEAPPVEHVIGAIRARIAARRLAEFTNWPIYAIGDRIAADAVVRYETMAPGLAEVLGRLGLGGAAEVGGGLPHLKGGLRPEGLGAGELPEDCKAVIRQVCRHEFAAFGYVA